MKIDGFLLALKLRATASRSPSTFTNSLNKLNLQLLTYLMWNLLKYYAPTIALKSHRSSVQFIFSVMQFNLQKRHHSCATRFTENAVDLTVDEKVEILG